VSNADEAAAGTGPRQPDSDGDRLSDGEEAELGSDPLSSDSDGDGVPDRDETLIGADPLSGDSDGDSVADAEDDFTFEAPSDVAGASLTVTGPGGLVTRSKLVPSKDLRFTDRPGSLGPPVEALVEDGVVGRLTLPFDLAKLEGDSDVVAVHLDTATGVEDQPPGQVVDLAAGTVTFTTDEFSPFIVVDAGFETVDPPTVGGGAGGGSPRRPVGWVSMGAVTRTATDDPEGLRYLVSDRLFNDAAGMPRVWAFNAGQEMSAGWSCNTRDLSECAALVRNHTLQDNKPEWAGTFSKLSMAVGGGCYWGGSSVTVVTVATGWQLDWEDRSVANMRGSVTCRIQAVVVGGAFPEADAELLQEYVRSTGGELYQVRTAADVAALPPLWGSNGSGGSGGGRCDAAGPDSDGDGVLDCEEELGLAGIGGSVYTRHPYGPTDPNKADTDGDGLDDGAEWGSPIRGSIRIFKPVSDPNKADTDGDGLTDHDELGDPFEDYLERGYHEVSDPTRQDTDLDGLDDLWEVANYWYPFQADRDQDGLDDSQELDLGTEPDFANTDFDYWSDAEEDDMAAAGASHNPLVFDEKVTKGQWITDFELGFFCGDLVDLVGVCGEFSGAFLTGMIVSGFVPVLGDARDIVANKLKGDEAGAWIAFAGFVPGLGDAVKAAKAIGAFAKSLNKLVSKRLKALRELGAHLQDEALFSVQAARKAIDELNPGMMGRLSRVISGGVSEEHVLRFVAVSARHGLDPAYAERVLLKARNVRVNPNLVDSHNNPIKQIYREADVEKYHHGQLYESLPAKQRIQVPQGNGWGKFRIPDDIGRESSESVWKAFEYKVGMVRITSRAGRQVDADASILARIKSDPDYARDLGFEDVVWPFFAKETERGECGPDPDLLEWLDEFGISFDIYLGRIP
jgi:hypothetical protein